LSNCRSGALTLARSDAPWPDAEIVFDAHGKMAREVQESGLSPWFLSQAHIARFFRTS
jgi:hypothetical protein